MNRRDRQQRKKDRRTAAQVRARGGVQPDFAPRVHVHDPEERFVGMAGVRPIWPCPECGSTDRVDASCEDFLGTPELARQHEEVAKALGEHYHLRCLKCGVLGTLGAPEYEGFE